MKNILLSLMIIILNKEMIGQDCSTDVTRFSNYSNMEILNRNTGKYEKYSKVDRTDLRVQISSKSKTIKFEDPLNDYHKTFLITGCLMAEDWLTYECIDQDNNKHCQLIFSASDDTFDLTVQYEVLPISYRVKRQKPTN